MRHRDAGERRDPLRRRAGEDDGVRQHRLLDVGNSRESRHGIFPDRDVAQPERAELDARREEAVDGLPRRGRVFGKDDVVLEHQRVGAPVFHRPRVGRDVGGVAAALVGPRVQRQRLDGHAAASQADAVDLVENAVDEGRVWRADDPDAVDGLLSGGPWSPADPLCRPSHLRDDRNHETYHQHKKNAVDELDQPERLLVRVLWPPDGDHVGGLWVEPYPFHLPLSARIRMAICAFAFFFEIDRFEKQRPLPRMQTLYPRFSLRSV